MFIFEFKCVQFMPTTIRIAAALLIGADGRTLRGAQARHPGLYATRRQDRRR